ncbi:hypothetical protein IFM89_013681 [Coptis chinensis]|uniref:non-specific serine/threonine protein kinase n=1 Tax=Coptis chinensis TaxID=261450 RepID=A0A835IMR0_9MAGN|nr:hypothetical protein IFM89_013681 [Coptis chinensis]
MLVMNGHLVLKDFDIVVEAGGPNKPIVKTFNASVQSNTLKIHFYWAGKGTTGIPNRGVYGPLISAISVDPNFKPPSIKKTPIALVVGVSASALLIVLLVACILWRKGCLGSKASMDRDLRSLDLKTGSFSLRQIKAATQNFDVENKLGEGGFGSVYKVLLFLEMSIVDVVTEAIWLQNVCDRGYLTVKADVYSFELLRLEIVSGKSNTNYRPKEEFVYLLDWAYVLQERGSLLELIDPNLGSEFSTEEAMVMLNVSLLCTNASPTLRPTMSQVVSMLEGRTPIQDLLSDPGFSTIDSRVKAIRNHFWQNPNLTQSMSTNGPFTDSSTSNGDREESAANRPYTNSSMSNADREVSGHLISTNGSYSISDPGTDESGHRLTVSSVGSVH